MKVWLLNDIAKGCIHWHLKNGEKVSTRRDDFILNKNEQSKELLETSVEGFDISFASISNVLKYMNSIC